jgi:hypothetical protein
LFDVFLSLCRCRFSRDERCAATDDYERSGLASCFIGTVSPARASWPALEREQFCAVGSEQRGAQRNAKHSDRASPANSKAQQSRPRLWNSNEGCDVCCARGLVYLHVGVLEAADQLEDRCSAGCCSGVGPFHPVRPIGNAVL